MTLSLSLSPSPARRSAILLSLFAISTLGLVACGDDEGDDGAAAAATTTTTATTTSAVDSTTTTGAEAATGAGIEGPDAEAIAAAVAAAFDSTVGFDDKAALLEGGESLRTAHDAYVAAAAGLGGIGVEATAVAVDGDTAEVTYRVLFAGTEQYADLTMTARRIDGTWLVPTDDFCGFLAAARTPC